MERERQRQSWYERQVVTREREGGREERERGREEREREGGKREREEKCYWLECCFPGCVVSQ